MKRYGYTAAQVIDRWSMGQEAGTSRAPVPGGRRLDAERDPVTGDMLLYSYRTIVAVRRQVIAEDGLSERIVFALTTKRYSVSTSKVMGQIRRMLYARGFSTHGQGLQAVWTAIPGRWGGFGPAWAASSHESVPFQVLAR